MFGPTGVSGRPTDEDITEDRITETRKRNGEVTTYKDNWKTDGVNRNVGYHWTGSTRFEKVTKDRGDAPDAKRSRTRGGIQEAPVEVGSTEIQC